MRKRTDSTTSLPASRPTQRAKEASAPAAARGARTASTTGKKSAKADEFSTGRAKALRRRSLTLDQPAVTLPPAAASAKVVAKGGDTSPSPVALSGAAGTAAVGGAASGPGAKRPVFSFDTTTYLSKVGNPEEYRITQQQCDELRRLGMEHGVVGMPIPGAPDYAKQAAALKQELTLLSANGIRTDTYSYLYWNQGGKPKSDAQIRSDMAQTLDTLKGQNAKTFWLDVEFDPKLNPSPGSAQAQRMLDTAYQAFQDWKKANPNEKVEFGIYTGKGAWDEICPRANDPYTTKYADQGVKLWAAMYPDGYAPKDAAQAGQDLQQNFATGFGGWSTAKGNVAGWQYRAGEHDGHQPTFNYGLDRNVWLADANAPTLPVTAVPSGYRADKPIVNQALYALIKGDQNKPIDQRQFKSMQDVINVAVHGNPGFKALGLNESECYAKRWEDPWKAVQGVPLGVDQFSTTPLPATRPASTTPASTAPATTPALPPPAAPPVSPTPPAAGTVAPAQVSDFAGLAQGPASTADQPRLQKLQDTLIGLGYLQDIRANSGYGKNYGPMTQAAVAAFQKAQALPATGAMDRATAVALSKATGATLGFDAASPYAGALGLAKGASAAADRPGIKAVQDALISQGYVSASMKSQTGYGTSFGPITEGGLKQFQLENGLPQTGVVDAATITALDHPKPRPAGFAAGLAQQYRDQLGFPTGPATTSADGSIRQDFERGSIWIGADHLRHVQVTTPTGPKDVVPPQKLGTAQSLAEADASFLSQWGPTKYNDPAGDNDHPWGFEDCGPTSSVMVLSALGLMSRPEAGDAFKAIDAQRDRILGYDSTASLGLALTPANAKGTVAYGLVQAGAKVNPLATSQAELDAALARGNPVIVGSGNTWAAWGRDQRLANAYLNNGNPGGHFITVLGRAADGNYIVGDPLSTKGPIEVTADQMKTCLAGAWGSGNSLLEVSRP